MIVQNIKKVDDNTISYEEVAPEKVEAKTYDITLLDRDIEDQQQIIDVFLAKEQPKLDELKSLKTQANNLGVSVEALADPIP